MPERQDQLVERLMPDFFHKQNPGAAWMHAASAHLILPVIRALWTMANIMEFQGTSNVVDETGKGYHVLPGILGDVLFGYDPNQPFVPIAIFGGAAGQYLGRGDPVPAGWADILGTEVYVQATQRGLTIGGWFWWSALPGAQEFLIGKDDTAGARQYSLILLAANTVIFQVWPGAIGVTSAATINVGWNHIIGIYDQPSQTLFVQLNGAITAGVVGAAPAALANTPSAFTIGAAMGGGTRFTGYSSFCFFAASSVNQNVLSALYRFMGPMFGRKI